MAGVKGGCCQYMSLCYRLSYMVLADIITHFQSTIERMSWSRRWSCLLDSVCMGDCHCFSADAS